MCCARGSEGTLFWDKLSELSVPGERRRRLERVSLQRAGVSKWWRELWETFISQIHFIDPGPVRAELTVVGGLEENEWLLAHMLTPKEPAALTLPQRLWNSLWWLFYQRSCPSPGRPRTGEDDPHFLKAKCSVLISRNELLVTRVNLLRPGRFIVSCHCWTHRADLYHAVLSRAAWTHGGAHAMRSSPWPPTTATEFQIMSKRRSRIRK